MTTPHYGHPPIDMVRRSLDQLYASPPELGHFAWVERKDQRILFLVVPCPGRPNGVWSEWPVGLSNGLARWSWDGNEDKPTLTQVLHSVGLWRGFVRAGQLVEDTP